MMKLSLSSLALAGVAGIVVASTAPNARATVSSGRRVESAKPAPSCRVAQISEEDVPSNKAAGGPADTSGASGQAPGSLEDWQQVPSNAPAQNKSAQPPAPPGGMQAAPSPSTAATPQVSSASLTRAIPPGPPPALDVTAITTSPDPSEATLEREVKSARSPSLAASIRLTEQARRELAIGKTDDAIRTLGRAVSIEPANPFQYFYLGRAYMVRKNYAQAVTFLKRAELGFGTRPDWLGATLSYEGACYEVLGKMVDAAHAYQRAFAVSPNNLMARVGFSRLAPLIAPPALPDAQAQQAQEGASGEASVPPPPLQPSPGPATENNDE